MLLFEEAEVGSLIAGVFVAGVRGVFGVGTCVGALEAGGLVGDSGASVGLGVTDSGSISTGLGKSFIQFSRYVLCSSWIWGWDAFNAFAVSGTSDSSEVSFFAATNSELIVNGRRRLCAAVAIAAALSTTDLGGHSFFSLTSSLAESPVMWETTLELRDAEPCDTDNCFDCVSNLPMRLATL